MREQDLDDLFVEARARTAPLDPGLLARVLADAASLQPRPASQQRAAVQQQAQPGFWASLVAALGGGRVMAGLGTITVASVLLGFAQPAPLTALTDTIFADTQDAVELLPGVDAILVEG